MNILLDTHTFIWFIENHQSLDRHARAVIEDSRSTVFLSIASVWEMAIKVSLNKLHLTEPFQSFIPAQLIQNDITLLGITIAHALSVATLPLHHRDPFDRLLIAQSIVEQIPLVSADAIFDAYPIKRIWS